MALLEVSDIVVRYGTTTALNGVSLTVEPGEVVALLGPNGAGKTTLLEAVEGYRQPSEGNVKVFGLDPMTKRTDIASRWGIMPQTNGLPMGVTVAEAVTLFAKLYSSPETPAAILESAGLTALAKRKWRRLSGGEQQRLSLALALAGGRDLLLLDEPTAAVDQAGRERILDIITRRAADGAGVLVTTHRFDDVEAVANRIVVLDKGRVAGSGTLVELTAVTDTNGFRAAPGLATAPLAAALNAPVCETAAGHYQQHRSDQRPTTWPAWPGARNARYPDRRTRCQSYQHRGCVPTPDIEQGLERRISAMTATELRIAARDGEQLLLTVGLPLLFLVFFTNVDVLPAGTGKPVDFIAPGIIVLALLSVAFVRPAISLGFDRSFGAIKRFAITPLTVAEFLCAKLVATATIFAVQLVLICGLAVTMGWRPDVNLSVAGALPAASSFSVRLLLCYRASSTGSPHSPSPMPCTSCFSCSAASCSSSTSYQAPSSPSPAGCPRRPWSTLSGPV
ncbi:MAG: ATP-binding cassette domain-containing protein [Acidimicrobiales bacterium]